MLISCPCGSGNPYTLCCKPLHLKKAVAQLPEQLMRARYAAYVMQEIEYLVQTTHPSVRQLHGAGDIKKWAMANQWEGLEIIEAYGNVVEFKAYFKQQGTSFVHHEISVFEQVDNQWYYLNGTYPEN